MNLSDRGIVIYKAPLKEGSYIVTLFTQHHGVYAGVVKSSKKHIDPALLEGNLVDFHWQARLHEHLGNSRLELVKSYNAHLLFDKTKLYAFNSAISLIRASFHEREPHNNLFPILCSYLEKMSSEFCIKSYINLELSILAEAGYALDFSQCADTGQTDDLKYISPKSGRAICALSGQPYKDKLLALPPFLIAKNDTDSTSHSKEPVTPDDLQDAFKLCSYFFSRYIHPNKDIPEARREFIGSIVKML